MGREYSRHWGNYKLTQHSAGKPERISVRRWKDIGNNVRMRTGFRWLMTESVVNKKMNFAVPQKTDSFLVQVSDYRFSRHVPLDGVSPAFYFSSATYIILILAALRT
jgi:hypothetical protein